MDSSAPARSSGSDHGAPAARRRLQALLCGRRGRLPHGLLARRPRSLPRRAGRPAAGPRRLLALPAEPLRHRHRGRPGAQHSHRLHRPDLAGARRVHRGRRLHGRRPRDEARLGPARRAPGRRPRGRPRWAALRPAVAPDQGLLPGDGHPRGPVHPRIPVHAGRAADRWRAGALRRPAGGARLRRRQRSEVLLRADDRGCARHSRRPESPPDRRGPLLRGGPRPRHRRRADRHQPLRVQAPRLRAELVLRRNRRRAPGLLRLRHQPPGVHGAAVRGLPGDDHHRRPRERAGSDPRRRLYHAPARDPQAPDRRGGELSADREHLSRAPRDHLRPPDRAVPPAGARGPGEALVGHQGVLEALALCLLADAAGAQQAKEPIPVGIIGDLSGPTSGLAEMAYSSRDYFNYLNEKKGGVLGHEVDVLLVDGAEVIPVEVSNYKRIMTRQEPVFIFIWSTGGAKALRDPVNKIDKIPSFAESISEELVDPQGLPFSFVIGPTYEDQIRLGLETFKKQGGKRVAIARCNLDWCVSPTDRVIKEGTIAKLGMELVETVTWPARPTDLTSEVLRLKQANPDFIWLMDSVEGTVPFLRDAVKAGISPSKVRSEEHTSEL